MCPLVETWLLSELQWEGLTLWSCGYEEGNGPTEQNSLQQDSGECPVCSLDVSYSNAASDVALAQLEASH